MYNKLTLLILKSFHSTNICCDIHFNYDLMQDIITFLNSTISKFTSPEIITLQQRFYRTIKRQHSKDICALVSLTHKIYINVLYGNR